MCNIVLTLVISFRQLFIQTTGGVSSHWFCLNVCHQVTSKLFIWNVAEIAEHFTLMGDGIRSEGAGGALLCTDYPTVASGGAWVYYSQLCRSDRSDHKIYSPSLCCNFKLQWKKELPADVVYIISTYYVSHASCSFLFWGANFQKRILSVLFIVLVT